MKVRPLIRIQDRILASFGRVPEARGEIVRTMLRPRDGDVTGYWLKLVIAAMLATLGLALNSTAVVIGAMLIAPLMRPLVEVAMGLATGSAALTLRATLRTVTSILVVVAVATLIAWLLPFQAITAELEARTAPTLLDLFVAGACALAAAYATLRADADIATTAAGTSIGISLVPPVCAVGYGLALGNLAVARGAALLFTANLSGILAIAAAVFVATGFGRVDIRAEERTLDEAEVTRGLSARAGRAWSRLARARLGPIARVVPPLLLIAIVYLPLHRALGEIQHRNEITQAVTELLLLVLHLGQPLGAAGIQLLAHALEPGAGPLNVREDALASVEAPAADGVRWLPQAISLVERARRAPGVHICATLARSAPRAPRALPSQAETEAETVRALMVAYLAQVPDAVVDDGDSWRLLVNLDECLAAAPAR